MIDFGQLLLLLLQHILGLFANPLYWVILLVIGLQYRKIQQTSQRLFAEPADPIWPAILTAVVFGFLGGILGSLLMFLVGVSIHQVGLAYLWVIALVLMVFQQRFLCFSYAGGIIAIANLFFGFPQVSIPHLMGLVAILHFVEAWLIFVTGPLSPMPVYVKAKDGRIVGGYNLQKFWPLPFVAFVLWQMPNTEILTEAMNMPDWLPLLKTEMLSGQGELVYVMAPVLAALGYGDIAVSQEPHRKTRRSALELASYSLILLALAILASHYPELAFLAAFFGPLGHEALIIIGQKREMGRPPLYVPPDQGIMVLHVSRNSPYRGAGVRNGDIILRVNRQAVDDYFDLAAILQESGERAELEYLSSSKQVMRRSIMVGRRKVKKGARPPLGIIPVPRVQSGPYLIVSGSSSLLRRWIKKPNKHSI